MLSFSPTAEAKGDNCRSTAASSVDGGLLVGAGIYKRFGALVVLDNVDFTLGAAGGGRHRRPERRRQDDAAQRARRRLSAVGGHGQFRGADVTALDAAHRCRLGIARSHQIPRPFGGMTVFENCLRRGDDRRRPRQASGLPTLRRSARTLPNAAYRQPARRNARACSIASGWSLRARWRPIRRCCCSTRSAAASPMRKPTASSKPSSELRRRGMAIVWIEHIVHVLLQVVERLVCMDAGRIIADGEPEAVIADAAVIDAYIGGRSTREPPQRRAAGRASRSAAGRARRHASRSTPGETLALVGANGAGKTTLLRTIAGAHRPAGRPHCVRRRRRHRACPPIARLRAGIALVPEGRRLFAGMTVKENLLVAGAYGRPGPWNLDTVVEAFPLLRARARQAAPAICPAASNRPRRSAAR